ncbi:NAD-dependent epimerase/dehydratase family protein [Xanthobacter tagetidis]|jgi:UDP-glucose 4-epimerase|uniref:NAD-dependent epimerase/dehydratase family protein n=1 Tax=Xanthobacter tagetidis TaxID=60216 RepID=A0A3L7AL96_9HYPH|nr:NAD-dependent epimerase/dehydratase family protein [Xanthobacter tagetidis]MBB6309010.1 UDP-glucose 4-epimerase [Xanthobacter tagetidis]RLP80490.1 NAD-dependent epimerase/dehydratase family protein [Xanthobacter tagetidis]
MTSTQRTASLAIPGGRFLIVGGASLVGSTTADLLLAQGAAEVVILDNFSFGARETIAHLEGNPRVRIETADITRLPQLLRAIRNVDGVIHLAAMMTISMDRDPEVGLEVNIDGVRNVIAACCANGVKKLVFASSNAVYGYGPGVAGELVETTPFHSAGAPPAAVLYGASKIIGEQLCRDAFRRYGLDYVILRYSTVYGERQHYRAANALYIIETHDRLKQGLAPRVLGDGSETKHFVYVGDVARANALALAAPASDVAVNLSGPAPVTTLELVNLVAEVAGIPIAPEHVAPEPGKVRLTTGGAFRIAHEEAERVIGWKPEVTMREGIRRLIAWREGSKALAAE